MSTGWHAHNGIRLTEAAPRRRPSCRGGKTHGAASGGLDGGKGRGRQPGTPAKKPPQGPTNLSGRIPQLLVLARLLRDALQTRSALQGGRWERLRLPPNPAGVARPKDARQAQKLLQNARDGQSCMKKQPDRGSCYQGSQRQNLGTTLRRASTSRRPCHSTWVQDGPKKDRTVGHRSEQKLKKMEFEWQYVPVDRVMKKSSCSSLARTVQQKLGFTAFGKPAKTTYADNMSSSSRPAARGKRAYKVE